VRSFVNVYLNDEDIRYLARSHRHQKRTTRCRWSLDCRRIHHDRAARAGRAQQRGNPPLQPPSDHPRGGHRRTTETESRQSAAGGTGGLGAPLALYLAAAGVGKIGLVDFDTVDFTNLQRQ